MSEETHPESFGESPENDVISCPNHASTHEETTSCPLLLSALRLWLDFLVNNTDRMCNTVGGNLQAMQPWMD